MKLASYLIGTVFGVTMLMNPAYAEEAATTLKLNSAEQSALAAIAAIDVAEIIVSEVALNKKDNSAVTDFANMMVEQHGANLTQILTMAGEAHATLPLSNGEAAKLAAENKKGLMTLGAMSGNAFDIAYANAMVAGHEGALKLIDTKLMKTAKSEEVKKFMADTRAAVVNHLEHAKKMQEKLKS